MGEYRCWLPADGDRDDSVIVQAGDAWHAAKIFAARADSESGGELSDGALRGGHSIRIHVVTPTGVETAWDVSPEALNHAAAYRRAAP